MVKKLGILGFILVVVAAAGMVWAETYTGAIPAPQPVVTPAAAPACVGPVGPACPPTPKGEGCPQKTDYVDRGQDAVSRAVSAPDAMWTRTGPVCAASHSRGGSHVEIHCALAPLRLLSPGRIRGVCSL